MENSEDEVNFKALFVPFTSIKAVCLIILLGLVVFFNGLFNAFVGDDLGQIVENPLVHSLGNISKFFTGSTFYNGNAQTLIGNYYRPLFVTFFSGIYSFFGPNYLFFHLFQILLHIGNAILVFLLFKLFLKRPIAFVLSLIFLVHPINSETALYISDTQEVLFFFFGMLYLLLANSFQNQKTFITANIFLFLSLLSKETGVLFLFITNTYVFFLQKKHFVNALVSGVSVFGIYLLMRLHAIGILSRPSNSSIAQFPLFQRLLNVPSMFFYYLKTFVLPIDLASSYQWVYKQIDFNHFIFPLFIGLLFLGVVGYFGFYIRKHKSKNFIPYIFFCVWFFVGMGIHMQIIPLDATVAEGWFYFPMVGLLGMIGIITQTYFKFLNKFLVIILVSIILFLLSIRTFIRTFDWRNELTIATHDLKVSKDAWGLENELSYAYFKNGRFEEARVHAQKSVQLHPFITNYINLGAAYFSLKDFPKAKQAFMQSLKYGDLYQTYENLGFLSLSYGDPIENIDFIKNVALKKHPQDGKLWFYLSVLEYNFGDKEVAKNAIGKAYLYDQSMQIIGTYNAIMNNKPVKIGSDK